MSEQSALVPYHKDVRVLTQLLLQAREEDAAIAYRYTMSKQCGNT